MEEEVNKPNNRHLRPLQLAPTRSLYEPFTSLCECILYTACMLALLTYRAGAFDLFG